MGDAYRKVFFPHGSEKITEDGTKSPEYALKADRSLRSPGLPGAHAREP